MRIREGVKYDFKDLLLVPQRSDLPSRSVVDIKRAFTFPHSKYTIECVPIIAANMSAVGTLEMAKTLGNMGLMVALHKHYSVDSLVTFFSENKHLWYKTFYTVGISEEEEAKLMLIRNKLNDNTFPKLLNIDVANGYTQHFIDVVKNYRNDLAPHSIIMAGNVVTPNMTEELILSGADIVKIGLGSGAVCTTRIKTGVGFPQLSAIAECSFAAHGKPHGHVCSDGGCTVAGDLVKAFAGGADFVMIGSMLSGTDECEGEWEMEYPLSKDCYSGVQKLSMTPVKKSLKLFGMSSKDAQEKFNGGINEYRAAEGKTVQVPYKGPVSAVIQDILGGIRSACTYLGASKIKDLPKCAEFIQVMRTHNTLFGD